MSSNPSSVADLDTRKYIIGIVGFSIAAVLFLFWIIYFKEPATTSWGIVPYLPAINATLNGACALCLICGFIFIKKKNRRVHMRFMVTALIFSALFLVSYLTYHHFQGDTLFTGTGWIRPVYFFVLISHIVLSVFSLPLALITVFFASRSQFKSHRRIARITFPIWLYVSVTGVMVFAMLRLFSG